MQSSAIRFKEDLTLLKPLIKSSLCHKILMWPWQSWWKLLFNCLSYELKFLRQNIFFLVAMTSACKVSKLLVLVTHLLLDFCKDKCNLIQDSSPRWCWKSNLRSLSSFQHLSHLHFHHREVLLHILNAKRSLCFCLMTRARRKTTSLFVCFIWCRHCRQNHYNKDHCLNGMS